MSLPFEPQNGPVPLEALRHSVSHIMADAVLRIFPEAKVAIGPPIEHGFYYDFELPRPLTEEDLPVIEEEMAKILQEAGAFERSTMSREDAKAKLTAEGQSYKVELLDDLPEDEEISFYSHGTWSDLCAGPHVESAQQLRKIGLKLTAVAGAYWRGDSDKAMLQRIYGTAWWSSKDLKKYMAYLEEVAARDHRKLGRELNLFSLNPDFGAGLVFWHPKLGHVRRKLEEWWWELHEARDYWPVYTPHVAGEPVFRQSGHLQNYADMIWAPMDVDGRPHRVKPMNCPGHVTIFNSVRHSYRDLPRRFAELGTVYRYEPSGTLHGMLRVRGFTQDDAHIFCTQEQLADEIVDVLKLVHTILDTFGYEYTAYLATRPEKSLGTDEVWKHAIASLVTAAERQELPLEDDPGGGVFYGPKIDFKIKDALGREWQGPTVQVDFNLPERFDIQFNDRDNELKRPVMVHRAIFGSLERFVGGLIEHFAAWFPVWLCPTPVAVLPITEEQIPAAEALRDKIVAAGFRANLMSDGPLRKRVRESEMDKIPYMAVIGGREAENGEVSVRVHGVKEQKTLSIDGFMTALEGKRSSKSLTYELD
ncbi:MAG: threonine--tRNA ligase [Planctomycetota bacterium]|nr:threonine--tRNA ligase [Planctomycetota bacterium]MDA1114448.1 threonine--tRNA ligase [Planctomycetota bacterium]